MNEPSRNLYKCFCFDRNQFFCPFEVVNVQNKNDSFRSAYNIKEWTREYAREHVGRVATEDRGVPRITLIMTIICNSSTLYWFKSVVNNYYHQFYRFPIFQLDPLVVDKDRLSLHLAGSSLDHSQTLSHKG